MYYHLDIVNYINSILFSIKTVVVEISLKIFELTNLRISLELMSLSIFVVLMIMDHIVHNNNNN